MIVTFDCGRGLVEENKMTSYTHPLISRHDNSVVMHVLDTQNSIMIRTSDVTISLLSQGGS